jgi:hypothetical protein
MTLHDCRKKLNLSRSPRFVRRSIQVSRLNLFTLHSDYVHVGFGLKSMSFHAVVRNADFCDLFYLFYNHIDRGYPVTIQTASPDSGWQMCGLFRLQLPREHLTDDFFLKSSISS